MEILATIGGICLALIITTWWTYFLAAILMPILGLELSRPDRERRPLVADPAVHDASSVQMEALPAAAAGMMPGWMDQPTEETTTVSAALLQEATAALAYKKAWLVLKQQITALSRSSDKTELLDLMAEQERIHALSPNGRRLS